MLATRVEKEQRGLNGTEGRRHHVFAAPPCTVRARVRLLAAAAVAAKTSAPTVPCREGTCTVTCPPTLELVEAAPVVEEGGTGKGAGTLRTWTVAELNVWLGLPALWAWNAPALDAATRLAAASLLNKKDEDAEGTDEAATPSWNGGSGDDEGAKSVKRGDWIGEAALEPTGDA
jgi:hypothetical protein